ncbi:MAG: imidazole glycerol phosphate synthase subunit HisF [Bacteroidales bacterium]
MKQSTLAKRIIPCLDIKDGRTVKGINFGNLRDAGDPVELGKLYSDKGADELVYLDITATHERRKTLPRLVEQIATHLDIPFTVGGGINKPQDAEILLNAGADKISINSAAVRNPGIIDKIAKNYGSQFITLAIDAKEKNGRWEVYINGGRLNTGKDLFEWAKEGEERGCGEILFTSMDHDGAKEGFALDALNKLSNILNIPVIASGGAGNIKHFKKLFLNTSVDAALAASVFHYKQIEIKTLKQKLQNNGITVRL